jgi:hypothetical protein
MPMCPADELSRPNATNLVWPLKGITSLIRAQKSVVPAPSDRDPAGETSCDIVLQFSPLVFVKQTRGPIVGADLC